ncbi:EspG family protein [Amycolatopsis arida]|uniref:EspG family protein n=1 Tax=Amycolatopsis arida TaxID=587909 RepID=A0A1I5YGW6_9PSEU|nr:ESAT-6 protein secretion system EspG family protein [Amycolatopsis arida]SFQ43157.1 EspG family protein [Amycolatopsis arida]
MALGVAGTEVRLGPVSAGALMPALLDALAPLPAGSGAPANVRAAADYPRACAAGEREGSGGFVAALRAAGARPAETNTVVRAVFGRTGAGSSAAPCGSRTGGGCAGPA